MLRLLGFIVSATLFNCVNLFFGLPPPVNARQLFNVYCNPIDPGSANCKTVPAGIKIKCIASSGGLAQCMDPSSKIYVNCVPYQVISPGDSGGGAIQLSCYSNQSAGPNGSKFQRDVFDDDSLNDPFAQPFD